MTTASVTGGRMQSVFNYKLSCHFEMAWLFLFKEEVAKGKGLIVVQKLGSNEMVSFKELLMANSIQVDALASCVIEEGIIAQEKYFTKLKRVQSQYLSNGQ